MTRIIIFTIVCMGVMNCVWGREMRLKMLKKKIMAECARELNANDKKYIDIGDYKNNEDEETTCMWACAFRRYMGEIFYISTPEKLGNKAALYTRISMMIDHVYKANFGNMATGYTREGVFNKVNNCYAKAKNECDFFKCTELHTLPLAAVNFYFTLYVAFHPDTHQDNLNL